MIFKDSGPGPTSVKASLIDKAPPVSKIVPVVRMSISSAPGLWLASKTAWRKEPSPLSAVLLTVKTAASAADGAAIVQSNRPALNPLTARVMVCCFIINFGSHWNRLS
jgi:hypothetical protein